MPNRRRTIASATRPYRLTRVALARMAFVRIALTRVAFVRMALARVALAGAILSLAACDTMPHTTPLETALVTTPLPVPPTGLYHGVYPGGPSGEEDDITPAGVDSYEATVGRQTAWIYFSNNWYHSRVFPRSTTDWIRARGSVPFIRLMLRSSIETIPDEATSSPETEFTLEHINAGKFDGELDQWGSDAADYGGPLLVEYGTEVNGRWFPWNGLWNGVADGPAAFVAAYRRIHDHIRGAGATNVTWVFHVNADSSPPEPWNAIGNYYPGDNYVDWVGLSKYGLQSPCGNVNEVSAFSDGLADAVAQLDFGGAAPKPILVFEFGASSGNDGFDPAAWADQALATLTGDAGTRIRGFSWWNESWTDKDCPTRVDMRVQTVPGLAGVFRARLQSRQIVDRPLP